MFKAQSRTATATAQIGLLVGAAAQKIDQSAREGLSGHDEPIDPVAIELAHELAVTHKIVKVRQRLAHREGKLVNVERTAEKNRNYLCTAAGCRAGVDRSREPLVVVVGKVVKAQMQAAKRQAVGWQHERGCRERAEIPDRVEIEFQRIAVGLIRPYAHVGRDLGQHLIA